MYSADADEAVRGALMQTMPHGYTNHTTGDGRVVIKDYRGLDAARRCAREADVLSALAGHLPVPPVLGRSDTSLRLGFLPGVHGQELLNAGLASQVLYACGEMLRRIHAADPRHVFGDGKGATRGVLVHGDYGPDNLLLDAAAHEVLAVVDWEWAHTGDPVEDMAWCEWIVRMHHPEHVAALSYLFEGYGCRPAWTDRKHAMVAQNRVLLALCEREEPSGEGARLWQQRLRVTESWTE
jgi:aminoglycoside phosphotransferase (APT) family kinase protein